MSIGQFKLTMDINFNACVQLSMLFTQQKQAADLDTAHRFHLVNVNSIAGHLTCKWNTDYVASKFALTGFCDGLR